MIDDAASDALARDRASDPRRSVLLQAPAGSGKTTVLTERLLRLLAEVEQPEEILAVTFTRKAAAEMRARVLKALRGEVEKISEQGRRLNTFARAALARAAQRGWNLAQDPGRLRIQTIDSFNFRLASQLTVTARAGGSLVITERPDELYDRAARRTLAAAEEEPELAADMELLFERLDNNWSNVQRLLADMLSERGHWLRYVLGHAPDALCARISASLEEIVHDHLQSVSGRLSVMLLDQAAALPGVGPLGDAPQRLPAWKRLASLTQTAEGDWRKPRGVTRKLGPEYDSPAARDALRDVIERLSQIPGLREALAELSCLPAAELGTEDSAAIQALSRVLRDAAVRLQAEFSVVGRVDHTYVSGAAREALTDGGLPTDLALRTGLSLRHILVDEFQDTSLAQFDLIEALTAGWDEGEGRTLFVVGDPMQSIYQFREAEVGLFLRARDHGIGAVRLEPLKLTRNFRSVPDLITWINEAFTVLFPATDDLRAGAVSFTRSVAGAAAVPSDREAKIIAPVEVRVFGDGNRDSETSYVTGRIRELRALSPTATIAVLVASRSHAIPIMSELEARGVEAVGVDLVPLRELSIVRDLVALLRALSHLGDRTAWLAVLRAPWCGVSLPTLTVLSERRDPLLIWEAMADEERLSRCLPADRERLARIRGVIGDALASRNTVPLADWLEIAWLRLGAPDAYPQGELRHARAFLIALHERVANGEWSGPQDLDSLLKNLFAQTQASTPHAVQIMTIHRAKGLEFDHVIVPGLDRDLNRGGEPLLRWLDLPRAAGESDLIMAPVPPIGDDRGDVSAYLKRLMSRRSANEQVRLLYVAATRAKQTLMLSGAPRRRASSSAEGSTRPRSGTLLACLWPAVEPLADTGTDTPAVASGMSVSSTESARRPQQFRRLIPGWQPASLCTAPDLMRLPISRQSLEPPEFSWVGETARHIGTVVHAALERLAHPPQARSIGRDRDFYIYQLRRHGVPERDLARAAAVVIEALTRTMSSERGRWIFDTEHREARSEWALTGIAAGRLTNVVIDRTFVDREGTRWVIDFKTSRHEGGGVETFLEQELERYRPQLQTYVSLARGLATQPDTAGASQRVRAGLYFPLLDAFQELPDV